MPALGLTYISFFDVDGDTTGFNAAGTAPGATFASAVVGAAASRAPLCAPYGRGR